VPATPASAKPRKRATRAAPKVAAPVVKVAVAEAVPRRTAAEPAWLVRLVLVLFLVGFASFLAREVYNFLHTF
jgi:hypothetical protein